MAITGDKPVYLAADCGGSTCRVRLYDRNGLMLAEGHGGAANAARSLEPVMSEIFRAPLPPACRIRHGRAGGSGAAR
jgi:N-acetylglucosamine kinase-like BadF-type ATPase